MAKTKKGEKEKNNEETSPADLIENGGYIEGLGRRKRATARVRIYTAEKGESVGEDGFEVNKQDAKEYFTARYYQTAIAPLEKVHALEQFRMSVQVKGGGTTGQAEAVRMGLARALEAFEPSWRGKLKRAGFLTRDPREKERKKYGLKKARRAPQWQKR